MAEVVRAIEGAPWEEARAGRHRVRETAAYGRPSPVTGRMYQWRTAEAISAEETDRLVVVTVLVTYSNERPEP